jgi:hypothetical protein
MSQRPFIVMLHDKGTLNVRRSRPDYTTDSHWGEVLNTRANREKLRALLAAMDQEVRA